MKEKDLEKCLDNLIIKGLIQEAEQDNAELEAALREMSEEDFLSLIYEADEEPIDADAYSTIASSMNMDMEFITEDKASMTESVPCRKMLRYAKGLSNEFDEYDSHKPLYKPRHASSGNKGWKIWTGAIASIAAILLIVFIPAHMDMNSRICESALLASEAYLGPSRGIDISSMKKEEVKALLPELEKLYSISIKQHRDQSMGMAGEQIGDTDDIEYYIKNMTPQVAGLDLVQAYLKLNQKDKAIEVLHELEANDENHEFRAYCRKMLEILK